MSIKVSPFMGGLGLDATGVFEVEANSTVTVGGGSGNVVVGTITFDGGTTSADLNFGDNDKAVFGSGSDMQIYHDGSNSIITEQGTGDLIVYTNGAAFQVDSSSGENMIYAARDAGVNLYHNNSEKLATTSSGIDVTGDIQGDGLIIDGTFDLGTL